MTKIQYICRHEETVRMAAQAAVEAVAPVVVMAAEAEPIVEMEAEATITIRRDTISTLNK